MRLHLLLLCIAGFVLAGCSSASKPDPKATAAQQWAAARSSVMLGLAQDQYRSGSFDKCRDTVDEALRLTPDAGPLHLLSARLYVEKGLLEPAERELELARQLSKADPEVDYLSGVVFQRWQRPEQALTFYKAAHEKAPAELCYLLAEGETLVALNRNEDALALLGDKVAYFEDSGAIRDAVGQLLLQAGRYEEAAAMLRQASLLSPEDLSIRERLGMALYFQKNDRDAIEVLTALVEHDGFNRRADLWMLIGQCQLRSGEAREARASFETASRLDEAPAAWRGLGEAAVRCDDLHRAGISLRRSIELDRSCAATHLLLGYVYVREDRLAEALEQFQTATSLDQHDTVSLCMQGYVLKKTQHPIEARQCLEKALQINPDDELASKLITSADLND